MKNKQSILMALLGIAFILVVWFFLSRSGKPEPLLASEGNGADKELVATLLALRAVTLEGSIFSEQAFLVLKDSSTPIVPEPVGRPNPFAPFTRATSSPASSLSNEDIERVFTPRQ